jgi:hypothetical protein
MRIIPRCPHVVPPCAPLRACRYLLVPLHSLVTLNGLIRKTGNGLAEGQVRFSWCRKPDLTPYCSSDPLLLLLLLLPLLLLQIGQLLPASRQIIIRGRPSLVLADAGHQGFFARRAPRDDKPYRWATESPCRPIAKISEEAVGTSPAPAAANYQITQNKLPDGRK